MKKLVLLFTVLILSLLFAVTAGAESFENYEYVLNSDDTVSITRYFGNEVNVEIPSEINGKAVVKIEELAFEGCGFTQIFIPESISLIYTNAFNNCNYLKEYTVDENNKIYTDDDGVLFNKDKTRLVLYPNAKSAESYIIPDTVTSIDICAFSLARNLRSITISKNVESIESNHKLGGILNIERFIISENNKYFSNDEYGVLFNKDKTVLYNFPCESQLRRYVIPGTVSMIADFAFATCTLDCIVIPSSVMEICYSAFNSNVNNNIEINHIAYEGSETDWQKIEISEHSNGRLSTTPHFEFNFSNEDITTTVIEATCVSEGYRKHFCSCRLELSSETIPAYGHSYKAETTAPTCNSEGFTTHTCTCGSTYTDSYIKALEHKDANSDYECDYGCGYMFNKPAPEEKTFFEKIIEWFKNIFNQLFGWMKA